MIAILIVWFSAGHSMAQQAAPKQAVARDLSFAPHWTKGESRIYEQQKVRRQSPKGAPSTQVASRARLDIKVVEANKKGFLLSWMISESGLDGPRPAERETEIANLIKAMEGWNVLIDLDESGNFLGVRNWKEIRSRTESLTDSILQSRKYQALQPEERTKFRSQLKARLETKEQIEELCTREAKAFLAPIGLHFKGGQSIQYESQLPNPRGGKPFPANARFEVSTVDPSSERAIIDWRQVVDPGAVGTGLGDVVSRLGQNLGRPPGPGGSEAYKSLTITDECRYLMDMRTGWVNDMKQTRLIRNQDGSSIEESLRIRRIDQPPKKSAAESINKRRADASPTAR